MKLNIEPTARGWAVVDEDDDGMILRTLPTRSQAVAWRDELDPPRKTRS